VIRGSAFAGKTYAVLGLARSGLATIDALLASGATVVAWDSKEEVRDTLLRIVSESKRVPHPNPSPEGEGLAEPDPYLKPLPFRGEVGVGQSAEKLTLADPLETDLTGFAAVIVSPGVPLNKHPIATHARSFGVPVIGDIELFAQARRDLPYHKVVGITGTNGKSTTTALIRHIIETAGVPVLMGGNIGLPIMGRDSLPKGGVYVLELSSYQLDLTFYLDCDVAVLTNITPDHLDRYDGFTAYAASKERLFSMQSPGQVAVIAVEDDPSRAIAAHLPHVTAVRSTDVTDQSAWPALQGPHNAQNAAIAIAVARALGLAEAAIQQGLASYASLPHRMERIAEKDGVLFINDSKATNATATAPALAAYPAVHWILGGLAKSDDLDDCAPYFDHVCAAYTIGTAGPMFGHILREAGKKVTESGTLAQAVKDAAAAAKPGEVVMLSPACASFDQFSDYEARGDAFRIAVEGLGLC
jgi:UDP-N-acetylmuramoylalanine--D-glutamate ligase